MRFLRFLVVVLVAAAGLAAGERAEPTFRLPAAPSELVQSEALFLPFAREVAAEVEAQWRTLATRPAAEAKILQSLRVHLSLYLGHDDAAREAAERIRAGQTDPAERAHAGLATSALIAGQREPRRVEQELAARLLALPREPATRAVLERARARIAALSREALLAEVRTAIEPAISGGTSCTLEVADRLVRVRHRLKNILPLREPMLRAYDAALAAQPP